MITPKFSRHLFSKDHRLIITNYGTIQQEQNAGQYKHDLKQNEKITSWAIRIWHEIISKLSPSKKKQNLKQPLSRGSRFKIHFSLGSRGNRESSQNYHGTLF